eukprot:3367157-Amphidinium_carterae.1
MILGSSLAAFVVLWAALAGWKATDSKLGNTITHLFHRLLVGVVGVCSMWRLLFALLTAVLQETFCSIGAIGAIGAQTLGLRLDILEEETKQWPSPDYEKA